MNALLKNVKNHFKPTIVTLPKRQGLMSEPALVTDYAIATGVRSSVLAGYAWTRRKLHVGSFWTQDAIGNRILLGTSLPNDLGHAVLGAGDRTRGVMPCFQNPEAKGLGLTLFTGKDGNQQTVLTIKGKMAYYPQTRADEQISAALSQALLADELPMVGDFSSDKMPIQTAGMSVEAAAHMGSSPYQAQINHCYHYQGNNYVHLEHAKQYNRKEIFSDGTPCEQDKDYWFLCEPVRVKLDANNLLKCQDILVASQFDTPENFRRQTAAWATRNPDDYHTLDVNRFHIGKYLNNDFLCDLEFSTEFAVEADKSSGLTIAEAELIQDFDQIMLEEAKLQNESQHDADKKSVIDFGKLRKSVTDKGLLAFERDM